MASEDCCFSVPVVYILYIYIYIYNYICIWYHLFYLLQSRYEIPSCTMIHLQGTLRILVSTLCDKTFIHLHYSIVRFYASSTFESTSFRTNCTCPQCVVCDSSMPVNSQKNSKDQIPGIPRGMNRAVQVVFPLPARIMAKLRPTKLKFGAIMAPCAARLTQTAPECSSQGWAVSPPQIQLRLNLRH